MTNVYFNDLFNILHNHLIHATKSVKIAVAWIDFEMFYPIFELLKQKSISISIISDDNHINKKHKYEVYNLINSGMLKLIKMPNYSIMHEKFCIIDDNCVLVGSYNWTYNASNNNFENLVYCDDSLVVQKFIFEFAQLNNVIYEKIYNLQKSQRSPVLNLCCIKQDDDTTAKLQIIAVSDIYHNEVLFEDYYDICLYNNISSLCNEIYNDPELDEDMKMSIFEFELHKYIVNFIEPLVEMPIHALAVEVYEPYHKNEEDRYLKVIWKNRFVSNFVNDRYEL